MLARFAESMLESWGKALDDLGSRQNRNVPETRQGADLYLRARRLVRAGEFEKATETLARAAAGNPPFPDALEAYGEMLDMAGQRELAMSTYAAHRKLISAVWRAAPDRPFVLRRTGRFTAEIAAYLTASRYVGNRPFNCVALGNAYLALGMPRSAFVAYVLALVSKPGNADLLALKGEALGMMGRHREALTSFNAALATNPYDADALGGRAIVRLALGEVDGAASDWRQQLHLMPAHRPSARACIALRLADYAVALPELERALLAEPGDPFWKLYRLTALRRLGRPETSGCPAKLDAWPAPLLALHSGLVSADEVLSLAATGERRTEALFQLAVIALPGDPREAVRRWRQVVTHSATAMIEYAAACHELARLGG
jgi:tetratricopeptide (TPR) repeat protein